MGVKKHSVNNEDEGVAQEENEVGKWEHSLLSFMQLVVASDLLRHNVHQSYCQKNSSCKGICNS